jgi:hypothetical protein
MKIILGVGGALVLIGLGVTFWRQGKEESGGVLRQCEQIGRDLLAHTNSARLSSIQPTLQRKLAVFLSAPARVEAVRLGDEPRPAEDMKATARVFLVNDRKERLGIRVQKEYRSEKYRVVGFWAPEGAPPDGN